MGGAWLRRTLVVGVYSVCLHVLTSSIAWVTTVGQWQRPKRFGWCAIALVRVCGFFVSGAGGRGKRLRPSAPAGTMCLPRSVAVVGALRGPWHGRDTPRELRRCPLGVHSGTVLSHVVACPGPVVFGLRPPASVRARKWMDLATVNK